MSHEEFARFLVEKYIGKMFKEYEDWLENRAAMGTTPPSPGAEAGSPSTEGKGSRGVNAPGHNSTGILSTDSSPPNLSEKASEIRSFVRANVNDKEHKHLTKSARNALVMLLDGRMLADMQDEELIEWYENWVEAVK